MTSLHRLSVFPPWASRQNPNEEDESAACSKLSPVSPLRNSAMDVNLCPPSFRESSNNICKLLVFACGFLSGSRCVQGSSFEDGLKDMRWVEEFS